MPTSRVIAAVNPKGGTGKTTVAVHLAVAVHRAGQGVTLLDADPQGSALDWHRRTPDGYDDPKVEQVGRNRTLAAAIEQTESDVVVIDSPARLDEQTGRVLSSSDLALVPVRPSGLDLWGTAEFLEVLNEHVDRGLNAAFVASQADVRTSLSDELEGALSGLGLPMLDGLTLRVSYARSLSEGRTVLDGGDRGAIEEVEALHNDVTGLL
jgi:chromosome partitioning protein